MDRLVRDLFPLSRQPSPQRSSSSSSEGDFPSDQEGETSESVTMTLTLADVKADHKTKAIQLSRQLNLLEKELARSTPDLALVEGKLDRATRAFDAYSPVQTALLEFRADSTTAENLENDPHIGQLVKNGVEYAENFDKLRAKAKKLISPPVIKVDPDGAAGGSSAGGSAVGGMVAGGGDASQIIAAWNVTHTSFPYFHGDKLKDKISFKTWSARVDADIVKNPNLSPSQKVVFIFSRVKPPASDCLEGLDQIPDNLQKALDLLNEEFATKRALHDAILKLSELPGSDMPATGTQLQLLHKLSALLRVIKSYDLMVECDATLANDNKPSVCDIALLPIFLSKMPWTVRKKFEDKIFDLDQAAYDKSTCDSLLNLFRKHVTSNERGTSKKQTQKPQGGQTGQSGQQKPQGKGQNQQNKGQQGKPEVALATSSAGNNGESNPRNTGTRPKNQGQQNPTPPAGNSGATIVCTICKSAHRATECSAPIPATQILQRLREANACNNCLSPGHKAEACRSDHKCTKCPAPSDKGKRHHSKCHI